MDAALFYRDIEEQLCQGDIFVDVPHIFLKERPDTPTTLAFGGKKAGALTDELSGKVFPALGSEVVIPCPCRIDRAILLTHGCEIDKDKVHRVVAIVRPMDLLNDEEKATIRNGGKRACFHLPSAPDVQEGYVDFRRICTVGPHWLSKGKRVKTLTDKGAQQLMIRMFYFFSRLRLDDSVFDTAITEEE